MPACDWLPGRQGPVRPRAESGCTGPLAPPVLISASLFTMQRTFLEDEEEHYTNTTKSYMTRWEILLIVVHQVQEQHLLKVQEVRGVHLLDLEREVRHLCLGVERRAPNPGPGFLITHLLAGKDSWCSVLWTYVAARPSPHRVKASQGDHVIPQLLQIDGLPG